MSTLILSTVKVLEIFSSESILPGQKIWLESCNPIRKLILALLLHPKLSPAYSIGDVDKIYENMLSNNFDVELIGVMI